MTDPESPSRRIATDLRAKITNGELGPGDRIPSTRELVRDWGVAMATASRALRILRDEGLVITRTGSGTVVRAAPTRAATPEAGRPGAGRLSRGRILAAALDIADREGLEALSMRRLAGALRVTAMSLYRHVAGREELEILLVRAIFGTNPLPRPVPTGWRERLEAIYRLQWKLYRSHPWLAELTPVTRPPLASEAMLHSELTLDALAQLPLDDPTRLRAALTLPALVHGLALGALREIRAEQETQLRNAQWWLTIESEAAALLRSGDFPRLAALTADVQGHFGLRGLDEAFDHALGRYLDGLAGLAGLPVDHDRSR